MPGHVLMGTSIFHWFSLFRASSAAWSLHEAAWRDASDRVRGLFRRAAEGFGPSGLISAPRGHAGHGFRRRSWPRRRMLQARFFIPILAFARTMPIVRTSVPPMSLACAPKMCSTRARTEDFVRLLPLPCSVSGLPRLPSRWM